MVLVEEDRSAERVFVSENLNPFVRGMLSCALECIY